jgi:hypothetical protein
MSDLKSIPAAQTMYCGPSISGIVKSNAIFIGNIPSRLKSKADENRYINYLIVPINGITEFKKAVKIPGTVENVSYNEVLKMIKGGMADV